MIQNIIVGNKSCDYTLYKIKFNEKTEEVVQSKRRYSGIKLIGSNEILCCARYREHEVMNNGKTNGKSKFECRECKNIYKKIEEERILSFGTKIILEYFDNRMSLKDKNFFKKYSNKYFCDARCKGHYLKEYISYIKNKLHNFWIRGCGGIIEDSHDGLTLSLNYKQVMAAVIKKVPVIIVEGLGYNGLDKKRMKAEKMKRSMWEFIKKKIKRIHNVNIILRWRWIDEQSYKLIPREIDIKKKTLIVNCIGGIPMDYAYNNKLLDKFNKCKNVKILAFCSHQSAIAYGGNMKGLYKILNKKCKVKEAFNLQSTTIFRILSAGPRMDVLEITKRKKIL